MEKIYHIYLKDRCIMHSLKEEEFHKTWNILKQLLSVLDGDHNEKDISYEELLINKEVILNSSH
jgi:hypothetical protein